MHFRSLTTRIVFFFFTLLVAVQLVSFLVINAANLNNAREELENDVREGEQIFQRILEQNRRQLEQASTVLAADFGFREAIATHDQQTILSALKNHGARIDASAMMLVSLDNQVLTDTEHPADAARPFPFPGLLEGTEHYGKASGIVQMKNGYVYQMVVVPVMAPRPIARVAMGFRIDEAWAKQLMEMTSLHVSLLTAQGDKDWQVLTSTLPAESHAQLLQALSGHPLGEQQTKALTIASTEYVTRVTPLTQQNGTTVVAVLQRSLDVALARFNRLRTTLLAIGIASLAASIIGTLIIAKGITRPLNSLAEVARKVQYGDYSTPLPVVKDDEIGALATTFNHMRESIAERERQIMRLAFHDSLTGLPNRAMFHDRLSHALKMSERSGKPLIILLLDLDRFKYVNDALGHHTGDLLLQAVAERLGRALRASDTVARLGGDEFGILLSETELSQLPPINEKLRQVLDEPLTLNGQTVDVDASIGAACYPEHGEDAATLLQHADIAMYQSKRTRSGLAVYGAELQMHAQEQLSLLSELRHAIEHDELMLAYQPKINLTTSQATSVECLVRWNHPKRGLLLPVEFIPFAEQTGYIRSITSWVLNTAINDISRWCASGLTIQVSVNISARDLLNAELPKQIDTMLNKLNVPPELLCLEITESGLMEDPARAMQTVLALRQLKVGIVIDDYGTGYSSLAYIKNLPVDELKIDRSFICTMATNPQDRAIVRSTIELGHNLGMNVVAEGVETQQDWDSLAALGCDIAQGYFIAKPMHVESFPAWARHFRDGPLRDS